MRDLPDDLPQDVREAIEAQMERVTAREAAAEDRAMRMEINGRQRVLRWSAYLCSCRFPAWPIRALDTGPPQAGCVVHGGLMLHPVTLEVL